MRDRERTEGRLLDALQRLIVDGGFGNVGISRVAREAGVSKELIYRYFGGMPQMIYALLSSQEYWTQPDAPVRAPRVPRARRRGGAPDDDAERLATMLQEQMRVLRRNEFLQEMRRWELIDAARLTAPMGKAREAASRAFVRGLAPAPGVDLPAAVGILLAGAIYLVLRAKTADGFFGVDLRGERAWRRFDDALAVLARLVYAAPPRSEAARPGR